MWPRRAAGPPGVRDVPGAGRLGEGADLVAGDGFVFQQGGGEPVEGVAVGGEQVAGPGFGFGQEGGDFLVDQPLGVFGVPACAGQALGLTETLPSDDRRLYGERYLADTLAVRLGGRAAERLVRGEASTGAADDLASATMLASQMVCEFGLSEAIGPVSYGSPPGGHPGFAPSRGYSEHTQWLVDQEVAAILAKAEAQARDLLTRHREALDRLTAALLEQETVSGDQVRALIQAPVPVPAQAGARDVTPGRAGHFRPGVWR